MYTGCSETKSCFGLPDDCETDGDVADHGQHDGEYEHKYFHKEGPHYPGGKVSAGEDCKVLALGLKSLQSLGLSVHHGH